jgi:hypothetical protein
MRGRLEEVIQRLLFCDVIILLSSYRLPIGVQLASTIPQRYLRQFTFVGVFAPLLTGQTGEHARADESDFKQEFGDSEPTRRSGRLPDSGGLTPLTMYAPGRASARCCACGFIRARDCTSSSSTGPAQAAPQRERYPTKRHGELTALREFCTGWGTGCGRLGRIESC